MRMYRFHTTVKDGRIVFKSDQHEKMYRKWLSQWEGQEIYLEAGRKKKPRASDQMRRYYWVYINTISDDTGEHKDDLHELFSGKFLGQGIREIFGHKVRRKKSTTTLSTSEFLEYLADIYHLTEIPLPDTRAYLGYSYHKL